MQTSDGATVVHMVCATGALSLLELLLLNDARADVQDFEGRYPVHWATLQSNTKVFTQLLKVWRECQRNKVYCLIEEGGFVEGESFMGKISFFKEMV